ncbi:hypothetical protein scyTo_0011767 [Scyliorhinus torazame]|uniref:Uncharacterized protein n=1 Tax=Scyliorhinus torazame TaxID=75743 RepID=A0A401NUN7_SCYTO|nr:hypothetical protein [Scyliorhinus torazame]
MAASGVFERQTEYLLNLLLKDEDDYEMNFRSFEDPVEDTEELESLGRRLRELGDEIDKELLDSFTNDFQQMAAQHAADKAYELFSRTVNQICQERNNEGLSIELNLLKTTASLGLQAVKRTPTLFKEIKAAMGSFINKDLKKDLTASGGYAQVKI